MTQYIVENKDRIPFKDMSDEDKLKIVNSLIGDAISIEVLCWDGEWHPFNDSVASSVGLGYQYRLKANATPLNIPWEHIHQQWEWAAMDENGYVYFYEEEPEVNCNRTGWDTLCDYCSTGVLSVNTDNINWGLSLTKRP